MDGKQVVKLNRQSVAPDSVDKKIDDFRHDLQGYTNKLNDDLIKIRDYVYQSVKALEDRLEENDLTNSELFMQKKEVSVKLLNLENRLKKLMNIEAGPSIVRKISLATRNQSPIS